MKWHQHNGTGLVWEMLALYSVKSSDTIAVTAILKSNWLQDDTLAEWLSSLGELPHAQLSLERRGKELLLVLGPQRGIAPWKV